MLVRLPAVCHQHLLRGSRFLKQAAHAKCALEFSHGLLAPFPLLSGKVDGHTQALQHPQHKKREVVKGRQAFSFGLYKRAADDRFARGKRSYRSTDTFRYQNVKRQAPATVDGPLGTWRTLGVEWRSSIILQIPASDSSVDSQYLGPEDSCHPESHVYPRLN